MKLEIDDDVFDKLVVASLNDSIHTLDDAIKKLKKLKNRKPHQERDLEDCLLHIDALKRTRYYYGGCHAGNR
jgi:hypothetical protein